MVDSIEHLGAERMPPWALKVIVLVATLSLPAVANSLYIYSFMLPKMQLYNRLLALPPSDLAYDDSFIQRYKIVGV
jgi:hypothetical protein